MHTLVRLVVGAVMANVAVAVAEQGPALVAGSTIQPGTRHSDVILDPPAASACRLGFVYDGTGSRAGHTYVGTAAHCVLAVGDDIRLVETGEVFGDVAVIGNLATAATDWALIEVRPEFLGRVSAAMQGSPQYPTGVTAPEQNSSGDPIELAPLEVVGSRQATMGTDDAEVYQVTGPVVPSDSGGPLAHVPTGRALGASSRGVNCAAPSTQCEFYEGPTVQGILAKAAAAGFPISLRTV